MVNVKAHIRKSKNGKSSQVRNHNRINVTDKMKVTRKIPILEIEGRKIRLSYGNDYIPLNKNWLPLKGVYDKLRGEKVLQASELIYFSKTPPLSRISEIEVSADKTLFRLNDGGFFVVGSRKLIKWE